ncbi:MAG TPA: hypothetical protein VK171_15255 [Fimbriimonas sp.]|nr:hypothetical protein [Fimbriimonas sp.]
MGFQNVLAMMDSPAFTYNEDDIEEAFLARSNFGVQDILSAYRYIERRSSSAESLNIPLHILWSTDFPQGATFKRALAHAVAQNLDATLEFLALKDVEQIARLDNSDVDMILKTAKSDAKQSTHNEALAKLRSVQRARA